MKHWWWLGLWFVLGVAHAATAGASIGAKLPFVGASGVVERTLRYSEVVRELGEPQTSEVTPIEVGTDTGSGGNHVFGYPERGLSFLIKRAERKAADPIVTVMNVRQPSTAHAPGGLALGLAESQAMQIIRAHYHVDSDISLGTTSRSLRLSAAAPGGARGLDVVFDRATLHSMSFQTDEPPLLSDGLKRVLSGLAVAVVLLGLLYVLVFVKPVPLPQRPTTPAPSALGEGGRKFVVVLALLGGAFGARLLGEGGYATLLGVILLVGALGGVGVALLLLARSGNRTVSMLANGVLMVLLLLYLAFKFFGPG